MSDCLVNIYTDIHTVENTIMHHVCYTQKPCIIRLKHVFHVMNILNHLQIKEGIEHCLLCPLCGHPLEIASVSVQRLYNLKCSVCTDNHATVTQKTDS